MSNSEIVDLSSILNEKVIRRFWSKVKKQENRCWEWQASCNHRNGYGQFRIRSKIFTSHKVAMIIAHKRFPRTLILHSCNNPKCVNPAHLRVCLNLEDRN